MQERGSVWILGGEITLLEDSPWSALVPTKFIPSDAGLLVKHWVYVYGVVGDQSLASAEIAILKPPH
jgi:hypothetical protein